MSKDMSKDVLRGCVINRPCVERLSLPPAICCNVSVFLSGNIAKDKANVTAFLAVFVMPLTKEPKCMVRAAPKFAPQ